MSGSILEHQEYSTLPRRNALYARAIAATVQPGDLVADLGCGVGVLGLFCLEAGAEHCWGIDSSAAIDLARESFARAGLADRYTCIGDSTFNVELPQPVDLIVCDHVGYLGFDYGIIAMMRDARQRMLKPGGRMIPEALHLNLAPISSDACLQRASGWSSERVPAAYHWIEGQARNLRYPYNFSPTEMLGAPVTIGTVDLAADEPDFFRFDAVLVANRAGRFDGLAGWFNCHLAGDVWMTNSPLDPGSIHRAQAFLPAAHSFAVAEGDEIAVSLRLRADNDLIAWTITPPGGAKPHKMSTFNARVLGPGDLTQNTAVPLSLTRDGTARAFVLAQVDGKRTSEEIIARVLAERPDLFPTAQACREFAESVLKSNCAI